jgi:hypothetical protein
MEELKWFTDKYLTDDLLIEEKTVCINFYIQEDLKKCLDDCLKFNIPYTFFPKYKMALFLSHLQLLKKKIEIEEKKLISKSSCVPIVL